MHRQLWVTRHECWQGKGNLVEPERTGCTDAQISYRIARTNLCFRFFDAAEDFPARHQKTFTLVRKTLCPCRSMEHLYAQPAFQVVHALADKWLAYAKRMRCPSEAT